MGQSRWSKPTRPLTIHRFWRELRAFGAFLVKERIVPASPMARVDEPEKKAEQVPHFTEEHVRALLQAASRTKYPRRDTAILTLLLDTGLRASELCGLRFGDVEFYGNKMRVLGKGNKERVVPFSNECGAVLRAYVRSEIGHMNDTPPATPLFLAERGGAADKPLTRHGLRFLIKHLAKAAGINTTVTKCSPHVFRHTCGYMSFMGKAQERSVMEPFGHTTTHMTNKYLALAQSDVQRPHQEFSPVEQLKKRR